MDLNKVFDGIGKKMQLDFEDIQSQVEHAGERGGEREATLREFLKSYLPSKYAVSNGEIVDENLQVSKQCDLVIYDHFNCPLLLAGKDYRVFPSEPVYAVIEVKSVLNLKELKDSSEKIVSVKKLERENGPIAGVVFAYTSSWKKDPLRKSACYLLDINQNLEPHQYIDLLCILDSGLVHVTDKEGYTRIPKDLSEREMLVWHELTTPVVLWFFIQLLDLLDGQTSSSPDYQKYVNFAFEIGIASVWPLTNNGTEDD